MTLLKRMKAAAGPPGAAGPSPSPSYDSVVLANSPVGYWNFDETAGTTASDSSGNANHGTLTGTTAVNAAPIIAGGKAVSFDGTTGQGVTIPDSATMDVADVFTIEAWIKRGNTSPTHQGCIFSRGANAPLVAFDTTTGAIMLRKTGVATVVVSTITLNDLNQHHIVVTKNGAASKIYIDGVDRTGTVTDQTMVVNTQASTWGADGIDGRRYIGTIDAGAVYNYPLTATQVAVHLEAGPDQAPTEPTPPVDFTPLWSGNFDPGNLSQYSQYFRVNSLSEPGHRITMDTSIVPPGGVYSARMELRPGDTHNGIVNISDGSLASSGDGTNRIGLRKIGYGNGYFARNENRYIRWAIYIPSTTAIGATFSNPWRAMVAWPSTQDGTFSPLKYVLHKELNGGASPNGTNALCVSGDLGGVTSYDVTQWRLQNPQRDAWYEFITHIFFHESAASGIFEHWMKAPGSGSFVKQTFNAGTLDGSQTANISTLSGSTHTANQRIAVYRNDSFATTDVFYYGEVYMASSLVGVGG